LSRLQKVFASDRKALIPFIVAGDPNLDATAALITELAHRGADIIELGVPFSDPVANGPIVQESCLRALAAGTDSNKVLAMVANLRNEGGITTPIVLFIYYNCLYRRGCRSFVEKATAAGVNGLMVPDLPFEEAVELHQACQDSGMDLIYTAASTSTPQRLRRIAELTTAFIYCVPLAGVNDELTAFIERLRTTNKPLTMGFDLSEPEQAIRLASLVDGVIVENALVQMIHDSPEPVQAAGDFVHSLRKALDTKV
jgi:tryptophan synthase alpha chain